MTGFLGDAFVLEGGLAVLAVVVLLAGLFRRGTGATSGWLTLSGLTALTVASFVAEPGAQSFGGRFVVDELALFGKRLFLASAAVSVLATIGAGGRYFAGRAAEYHFMLLASLIGMLVLASARELILLFVAFELMSIPLYVLTGFQKRDAGGAEAALKFFLVGTVSSAVILYGLSFVYGATGTTDVAVLPGALATADPLLLLGMALALAGLGC